MSHTPKGAWAARPAGAGFCVPRLAPYAMAPIDKSSRHSKITGDFAEYLFLYWLSKHGFECSRGDQTGIDLIAGDRRTHERKGISVKCRSRVPGKETTSINLYRADIKKAEDACIAFGCKPYFAIAADLNDKIVAFMLPAEKLAGMFKRGSDLYGWKMTEKALAQYSADPAIEKFELLSKTGEW